MTITLNQRCGKVAEMEARMTALERDQSRRRSVCHWLVCALKEAGLDVQDIDLKTDGVCEWANVLIPRGIFKVNVTGDSDLQMMIDILTYIRGR